MEESRVFTETNKEADAQIKRNEVIICHPRQTKDMSLVLKILPSTS